jgi:hypothetical protein
LSEKLIPQIPWDQKLDVCCLDTLEEILKNKNKSHLYEWIIYHKPLATQITSNYDSMWACGEFFLKMGCILIFFLFFEESLYAAM